MPKNSFICEICGYKTSRKFNLELHINKKTPCVIKDNEQDTDNEEKKDNNSLIYSENTTQDSENITQDSENITQDSENITLNLSKIDDNNIIKNEKKCLICNKVFATKYVLRDHKCKGSIDVLQCPTCLKFFSSAASKSRHIKSNKCEPPPIQIEEDVDDINIKEEYKKLKEEFELIKSTASTSINNTTNTTNNTVNDNSVNDNSVTTNNTIIYNNYNKPYTGHISKQTMIDIYNECKSEMGMMIYSLVKKIYKDHPENDCIKFPEGIKSGFAEVQYNDQKCILPVNEVLETVLTKTTSVGKKKLMKAYENDDVIGHNMEDILDEMSTLSLNFRNEKEHRGLHLPYVKSALML